MHVQTVCTRPLLGGEGPGDEASMPYFFKAPNLPTHLLDILTALTNHPQFKICVDHHFWKKNLPPDSTVLCVADHPTVIL